MQQRFYWTVLTLFMIGSALTSHCKVLANNQDKRELPRFATLRANEVNLRRGPGKQYPNDWVYIRAGLPVEIIAEFDVWRQIRDHEGTEGWTHQSMLSGRRNIIIVHDRAKLYKHAEDEASKIVAIVSKNAIGRVLECTLKSCKIQFENHKGWLKRHDIWGVKIHEQKFK